MISVRIAISGPMTEYVAPRVPGGHHSRFCNFAGRVEPGPSVPSTRVSLGRRAPCPGPTGPLTSVERRFQVPMTSSSLRLKSPAQPLMFA
jgi:hypothetical protein